MAAAAARGQEPERDEPQRWWSSFSLPWTLHADGTATLHARYPLGLNALAKGWIVDRMAGRVWDSLAFRPC